MQFTPMLGRAMAGEEDNVDDNSRNRTCASRKNSSRATTTSATNTTTTTTTGYYAGGSSNNNSTAVSRSHAQRGSAHAHEGRVTPLSSVPPSKETSAGAICDEAQSLGELEGIFHASHGRDALLTDVVHAPAVDNVGLVEPDEAVVRPDSPYCVEVETGMVMTLVHPCMEPVHVRLLQLQRAIRHEAARLHALRRRAQQFHQNAYPAIELETMSVENGSLASTTTASASRDHSARNHKYSSHQGSSARRSISTSSSSSGNHVHRPRETGNERQANHNVSTAEDDSAEAKLLRDCMTSIYLGQAIPKPTLGRNNNAKAHEKEVRRTAPQPSPPLQPVAPLHNAHVDESGEDDDEEDDEVESVGSREEGKSIGSGGGRQRRPALQPLSSQELVQLRQSSQRLALLYRQRGIYLRRMDALLRQHANCNERWESNEERTTCYRCHRPFSALTRRHHCRRCGRLCCAECSCHFGKKQDTSCLPPSQSEDHIAAPTLYLSNHHTTSNVSPPYRPHSVVRTEYAVRLTEADTGVDPEERYDSYTYPNVHTVHDGSTVSNTGVVRQGSKAVQRRSRTRRQDKAGRHAHGNCHTGSVSTALTHLQEEQQQGHDTTSTSNTHRAHVDDLQDEQQTALVTTQQQVPLLASHPSGLKHHEWVRICTTCYNNCLRARKTDILKRTKNANRCILDDGYYYFYVLTADELHCVGTLMDKPDSLRKQVELQSCALLERSADYIVGVPSYGTRMLTSAAQQTPQVLRTLGSMSLYAARRARKAATDCVETYLVTREASTRQARQPPHVDTMAEPEAQEHDRSSSDEDGEAVLLPAADVQASDGEDNANTPAQCAANDL